MVNRKCNNEPCLNYLQTFVCPDGGDGQFVDPFACESYYLCVSGIPYPYVCINLFLIINMKL